MSNSFSKKVPRNTFTKKKKHSDRSKLSKDLLRNSLFFYVLLPMWIFSGTHGIRDNHVTYIMTGRPETFLIIQHPSPWSWSASQPSQPSGHFLSGGLFLEKHVGFWNQKSECVKRGSIVLRVKLCQTLSVGKKISAGNSLSSTFSHIFI